MLKKGEKKKIRTIFIQREEEEKLRRGGIATLQLLINLPLKQNAYRKLKRGEFCSFVAVGGCCKSCNGAVYNYFNDFEF